MSESNFPPVQPVGPAIAPVADTTKQKHTKALLALIFGIVALVCAFIPGLSFIAFIPAIASVVLGIAALVSLNKAGRGQAVSGVILGPIALLVAIIVSIGSIVGGITPDIESAVPPAGSSGNDSDGPAAPAAKPTAEPVAEPVAEIGTRSNPAPAGTTVEMTDNSGPIWQITMGAAAINANDIIAGENMFNDAPDAGFQYMMVPVTFTYVGSQSGTPWLDVDIAYVSAAGTTHEQEYVVAPNPINDIAELYTGGTATGHLVVMVPSTDVELGSWAISPTFGEKFFVKVI